MLASPVQAAVETPPARRDQRTSFTLTVVVFARPSSRVYSVRPLASAVAALVARSRPLAIASAGRASARPSRKRCCGDYPLPRRERRTEGFAAAVLDLFLAGLWAAFLAAPSFGFGALPAGAPGRRRPCATARSGAAVGRGAHFPQHPSRRALSSVATSIGPATSWPQDVVVVALLVRRCHSPDAPAARKSGRIQSDTARQSTRALVSAGTARTASTRSAPSSTPRSSRVCAARTRTRSSRSLRPRSAP